MKFSRYLFFLSVAMAVCNAHAQTGKDTLLRVSTDSFTSTQNPAFTKDTGIVISKGDTLKVVPIHNPGTATLRSLILPGWGQAYNKRYWEIPIVWGALGVTGAIYLYNNKWYKRTRDAYDIRVNRNNTADTALINPKLQPLSANSLQSYRNSFRRDRDYSALWFIIFWGLNIVDATVFGHLKAFDVSEDLSLKVNPVINWNGSKGIGLALGFKNEMTKVRKYMMP